MFEHWLLSGECWAKSKLTLRLRNKTRNAKRGLRRWMTRFEMEQKWGKELAAAIIEEKENDEHLAETEIRPNPDCPKREAHRS